MERESVLFYAIIIDDKNFTVEEEPRAPEPLTNNVLPKEQLFGGYAFKKFLTAIDFKHGGGQLTVDSQKRAHVLRSLPRQAGLLQEALRQKSCSRDAIQALNLLAEVGFGEKVPIDARGLGEFAIKTIQINLPTFEQLVRAYEGRPYYEKETPEYAWDAISNLARFGTSQQRSQAVDCILQNFEPAFAGVRMYGDSFYQYTGLLDVIFRYGNPDQVKLGWGIIDRILENSDERYKLLAARHIPSWLYGAVPSGQLPVGGYKQDIFRHIVERYGLSVEGLRTVVDAREIGRDKYFDRVANLVSIISLEQARPGICRLLGEEYNLRHFYRYPSEVLIRQYDAHGSSKLPYGVVLYPDWDHNGAFARNSIFEKLSDDLSNLGYAMRIFECKSTIDVARALIKANRWYGARHRISFAVIGGHGESDRIRFGRNQKLRVARTTTWEDYIDPMHPAQLRFLERHGSSSLPPTNLFPPANLYNDFLDCLRSEDLQGQGAKKAFTFFESHPTIILESCSTGAEKGIGQALSQLGGAEVIAPDTPTATRGISVTKGEDGRLIFR